MLYAWTNSTWNKMDLNKDILIEDCYWGFLMIEHTYYSFKDVSFLELVPPYIKRIIPPI